MAQRKALEQRISALEDGLKASSDLVNVPCNELVSEMQKIDEKLDIAKERLHTLEQEEYLEELGKSLNRSNPEERSQDSIESNEADTSAIQDLGLPHLSSTPLSSSTEFAANEGASSSSTASTIIKPMKASNRLPNPEASKSTTTTTLEKPATAPQPR